MTEYVFACPECGKKLTLQLHLGTAKPVPKVQQRLTTRPGDLDADLEDYNELLHVTNLEGALCYRPKKYLERETWDAIDTIIHRYGGKWVPGGTDERHWEVPTP